MKKRLLFSLMIALLMLSIRAYAVVPPPSPANDECSGAIDLPVQSTHNMLNYTNLGATVSAGIPAPTCYGNIYGDVWFKFVVPASGHIQVATSEGSLFNSGMAIYSGTCGNLSLVECNTYSTGNDNMPTIDKSGLSPGSTLYIRLWGSIAIYGNFYISVRDAQAPVNDECANAIALTVGQTYDFTMFDNKSATPTAAMPYPQNRPSTDEGDIWFKVVVPSTGFLKINCKKGTLDYCGMALYSGTCGALVQQAYDFYNSPDNMPMIEKSGLTPGDVMYIRVWNIYSNEFGDFGICVLDSQVTYPIPYVVDYSVTDMACNNLGMCQINGVIGGTPPYTYNFNNEGFSDATYFFVNQPGDYYLEVKDVDGDTYKTSFFVNQMISIQYANFTTVDATCGQDNGQINIAEVIGGMPPYLISLNGSAYSNSMTFTDLPAGDYNLSIMDNNCYDVVTTVVASIYQNGNSTAPSVESTVVYCQNEVPSQLNATGNDLLWYTSATGGVGSAEAPTPSTAIVGTTSYYVSQASSGCESARAQIDVVVRPLPAAPIVTSPINYCLNDNASQLTAIGADLLWFNPAYGNDEADPIAPTPYIYEAGTTSFFVTQNVNACESPRAQIDVVVHDYPSINVNDTAICKGNSVALNSSGANTYKWSTGELTSSITKTPLVTTTYTITGTSIHGCLSVNDVIVTVREIPTANLFGSTIINRGQTTELAVDLTGVAPWSITYTDGVTPVTINNITSSRFRFNISPLSTTTYTLTNVSGGNCSGTFTGSATITVNSATTPAPVVSDPAAYCQGGTAMPLTATGTSLKWYADATTLTSSTVAPTPSTAVAGITSYYVSQTLNGVESDRARIDVTVNALPYAPVVMSPIEYCQNATATPLTAVGSNLKWYADATTSTSISVAPTPSTSTVGTMSFYVAQTVSTCESPRARIDVVVNALPNLTISPDLTICKGATAALTAGGAQTYSWSNGGSTASITVAPTASTTYTVTGTSNDVCENSKAVVVTVEDLPTAQISGGGTINKGETAELSVDLTGAAPWSITYTDGVTPVTVDIAVSPYKFTVSPLKTTTYTLSSVSSGACDGVVNSSTVVAVDELVASISIDPIEPVTICEGADHIININVKDGVAPYTYNWSASDPSYDWNVTGAEQSNVKDPLVQPTVTTTFTVVVSDNSGSTAMTSVVITVNPIPALPVVTTPIEYCQNSTAVALTAIGVDALNWYVDATLGTTLPLAPTPSTTKVGTSAYFVSQIVDGCEGPRAQIDVNVINTSSIKGVVSYSGGYIGEGDAVVRLYKKEENGKHHYTDSVSVGANGTFELTGFAEGDYFLNVKLNNNSNYQNVHQTYHDSTLKWNDAYVFHLQCGVDTNVVVKMVETAPMNKGAGHVEGSVNVYSETRGGRANASSVTGVSVYAINNSNKNVVYGATTNDKGEYSIINMLEGTYSIYVDMPGYPMIETYSKVAIAGADTLYDNLNFFVDTTAKKAGIYIDEVDGIKACAANVNSFNISPMPASDFINIDYTLAKADNVVFELCDMTGKTIAVIKATDNAAGKHKARFDFNKINVSKGCYFVKMVTSSDVRMEKVLVE